jgi:hypothetical protein
MYRVTTPPSPSLYALRAADVKPCPPQAKRLETNLPRPCLASVQHRGVQSVQ